MLQGFSHGEQNMPSVPLTNNVQNKVQHKDKENYSVKFKSLQN